MFKLTRRTALGSSFAIASLASGAAVAAGTHTDDAEDQQYEQGNSNA